ncbi:MAG TPA: molybdenum cofactor biosynthesis protein MoaE, partial [Thermoanaerobaculia bacterium]
MTAFRYLTDDPIDIRDVIAAAGPRASDGAHVVFAGVVRDHHEGHAVESIFYDAYRPMAEKELGAIADAVRAEYPDVTLAVVHRLGHLRVGELSIAIVTASPHRAEAFDACRAVIERIKEKVPIWKKEKGPNGEEWVGW